MCKTVYLPPMALYKDYIRNNTKHKLITVLPKIIKIHWLTILWTLGQDNKEVVRRMYCYFYLFLNC